MEKDLVKFNEKLQFTESKEVCNYIDEKGNYLVVPMSQLLMNCEYLELDEKQLKIAIFEGKAKKDAEYNKIMTTRVIDKYTETKKEKDKGTLIDKDVEVYQVWLVRNNLGLMTSYDNKEEAHKYIQEHNNKILVKLGV